MRKHCIFR